MSDVNSDWDDCFLQSEKNLSVQRVGWSFVRISGKSSMLKQCWREC